MLRGFQRLHQVSESIRSIAAIWEIVTFSGFDRSKPSPNQKDQRSRIYRFVFGCTVTFSKRQRRHLGRRRVDYFPGLAGGPSLWKGEERRHEIRRWLTDRRAQGMNPQPGAG
jgi:hypothetical protein